MKVRVHSHEGAATLHPRRYGATKAAMIRMTTMPSFVPLVFQTSYQDVLELRFADVTTEGWARMQADEGDLIAEALAQGHACWPPTKDHMRQIIEFADKVRPEVDLLVVHCDAGVSRSSAVAMALCEKFELVDELRQLNENRRYRPNHTIRAMLREFFMPSEERQRLYDRLFAKEK